MRIFFNIASSLSRQNRGRLFASCAIASKPAAAANDEYPAGWNSARPFRDIPGPSKLQLIRWLLPGGPLHNPDMLGMQKFLRNKYGPLAKLPGMMGKADMVFTSDPRHFEIIYATEGNWPVRRSIEAFQHYCKVLRPDVFQGMAGIASDQGESWHKLRREVNPLMLSPKTVRAYMPDVDDIAREFVERLGVLRDANGELPADFLNELGRWSLETLGVMALDRRFGAMRSDRGDEVIELINAVRDFLRLSFIIEMKPPIWRYYKTKQYRDLIAALDIVTTYVSKYVDDAKAALQEPPRNKKDTEVSVLQKLIKKNPLYAFLSVYDLFFAGNDTTASAMGTLLYHLATNPDKQEKLREEVFRLVSDKQCPINSDNYLEFNYFRACMKESLRLQPLVPANLRGTIVNIILDGYRIPKNTDLYMLNHMLQTSEEHFAKSNEFVPERWIRGDAIKSEMKTCNPFIYLPFGYGPRACIGKRFAEMEMLILTTRILREYRVEWHYGPLQYVSSLVVTPVTDLKFKLTKL